MTSHDHRIDLRVLVDMLSGSVGREKAREALCDGAATLGLDVHRLSRDDGLHVLEQLATTPGIVGVSARFARSRLILQWARENL